MQYPEDYPGAVRANRRKVRRLIHQDGQVSVRFTEGGGYWSTVGPMHPHSADGYMATEFGGYELLDDIVPPHTCGGEA